MYITRMPRKQAAKDPKLEMLPNKEHKLARSQEIGDHQPEVQAHPLEDGDEDRGSQAERVIYVKTLPNISRKRENLEILRGQVRCLNMAQSVEFKILENGIF